MTVFVLATWYAVYILLRPSMFHHLCLDVHGSVYHNTDLLEMTNKMQLCRTIYYSIVP